MSETPAQRTQPLVLVSNRGPVTFEADGSVQRGTGGGRNTPSGALGMFSRLPKTPM